MSKTSVIVKPGSKGYIDAVLMYHTRQWATMRNRRKNTYLDEWSGEMVVFWWMNFALVIVMLVLPVALIAITLWTLLGYLWLLIIPVTSIYRSLHSGYGREKTMGNHFYSQLTKPWSEYALPLYKAVWNHNCNAADWDKYKHQILKEDPDLPNGYYDFEVGLVECDYCNPLLMEMLELLRACNKSKLSGTSMAVALESSRNFRAGMKELQEAQQDAQTELMQSISRDVKRKASK